MTWRLSKADFEKSKGEGNRKKMHSLVANGENIGVLAMNRDVPVGWCAVAPRGKYIRLQKSRALKPTDDKPVWAVSCFFIAKDYRKRGVSVALLKAALGYARSHGADIVEGYPIEPKDKTMPDVFAWTGILSTFLKAGFVEVKRHSPARPIVRYYL